MNELPISVCNEFRIQQILNQPCTLEKSYVLVFFFQIVEIWNAISQNKGEVIEV